MMTSFGQYRLTEQGTPIKASGVDVGGGAETLIICSTKPQSERCRQLITKDRTDNTLKLKS